MEPVTLAHALEQRARHDAGKPALHYDGTSLSLADLDAAARRCATVLAGIGIGRGDRVALWMPTSPAWLVAFFALARLGAVALATNTRFRGLELSDIFGRARLKAVVWWPGYRGIDFPELLAQARPQVPTLGTVITVGDTLGRAPPGVDEMPWSRIDSMSPYPHDHGEPGLPSILFTTSGTTRKPKLVVHAQASLVQHGREVGRAMGYARPGAASYTALPLAGTFGFTQTMACLMSGTPLVLADTFDAGEAARLMRRHRVDVIAMTYEMATRIFAACEETVPFPGLQVFTGSHADRLVELSQARGFRVCGVYGSSEVHALFSRRAEADEPVRRAWGGGIPVSPGTRVRVTDLETGAVLDHEVPGQIEIRSETMTLGYDNDDEASARAFTADGWFRSGDLGSTCADGSFRFLSRLGDSLRLRGFLVSPLEIEAFVCELPGVELAQVVGADGPDGMPCAVCFFKVRDGAQVEADALRAACVAGMASYKVPARFVAVDDFPIGNSPNAVKIDRIELRRRAALLMRPATGSTKP